MAAEARNDVALRALSFELLGMRSDYYKLTMGFSLAMGLFALSLSVLQLPPPIVTFSLASLAFAAALIAPAHGGIDPRR